MGELRGNEETREIIGDCVSDCSRVLPTEELLNGACGGEDTNGLSEEEEEEEEEEEVEEVPVDENLFTGEDLEELDEELNELNLED
ncbi:hypothetical protein KUCAC02_031903 [Chaenocephalus aceratus]|nr:hypothetical protein KUCAC02_031903 [Chaenocephalus aceratus]